MADAVQKSKKPMPKFAVRKGKRRYFVSDENGVLKEAQIPGNPGSEGGTVGVWGAASPLSLGTVQSSDEGSVGEVQEFPDENGEAQGLLFLNEHEENSYEFLMASDTTPPAFGDVVDTDKYVTKANVKTQAKGWKALSVTCRSI